MTHDERLIEAEARYEHCRRRFNAAMRLDNALRSSREDVENQLAELAGLHDAIRQARRNVAVLEATVALQTEDFEQLNVAMQEAKARLEQLRTEVKP